MTILIAIILTLFLFIVLPTILTNASDYKFYRRQYEKLSEKDYRLLIDMVVSTDGEIDIFTDGGLKIKEGVYLHNNSFTHLDPYAYYWFKKYHKWFKENIDINTLRHLYE